MIVSFSRKFVFVHTPKTAGESITLALCPFLSADDVVLCPPRHEQPPGFERPRGAYKHARLAHLRASFGFGPAIADFYSFGFVRNPWDRIVSYYQFLSRRNFARHVETGNPYHPCWHWTKDLDFVGRFESLEADFSHICRRLGISAELPHVNATERGPYRQYFDEVTRDIVARRYADDLREYGYEF
jgi:hypothetical protein